MKKPTAPFHPKAPRMGKKQFSTQIVTRELYKRFIKTFPEYKGLSWKAFYQGWEAIAETIRQEAVTNPLGVKLEHYCGELKVQYLPYKFKTIDPLASAEMQQPVYYLNLTTRGKVVKIKWERRAAVKSHKMLQFYSFEPHHEITSLAKDYILANSEKIRTSRNTLGGRRTWR